MKNKNTNLMQLLFEEYITSNDIEEIEALAIEILKEFNNLKNFGKINNIINDLINAKKVVDKMN